MISGTPAQAMANTTYTIWANQSGGTSIEATFWLEVLEDTDGDGMPDEMPDDYDALQGDLAEDQDDDNDGSSDLDEVARGIGLRGNPDTDGDGVCDGPTAPADGGCTQVDANSLQGTLGPATCGCCAASSSCSSCSSCPAAAGAIGRARRCFGDLEPENTRADPKFIGGRTREDPFILALVEGRGPASQSSKESITIDGMSMIDMVLTDLGQGANGDRFGMREADAQEGATRVLPIDFDGEATINMVFDDGVGGPPMEGKEFTGLLSAVERACTSHGPSGSSPDEGDQSWPE